MNLGENKMIFSLISIKIAEPIFSCYFACCNVLCSNFY